MTQRRALITGITGQDGSYLAELLVARDYQVFGMVRRSSHDIGEPIETLRLRGAVELLYADMRDNESLKRSLERSQPDEIYNLASQSHVGLSFEIPEETFAINRDATVALVQTALAQNPNVRIYQASSSEMFGDVAGPQNEMTAMHPTNPYGESKLQAYREAVLKPRTEQGAFICSGILYNHESPRRGKQFVTRKITHSFAKIKLGLQETLEVGNIHTLRDWGYAADYVDAMWRMMQHDTPDDFVIATGTLHSVKDVIDTAAHALGMTLTWNGEGVDECAVDEHDITRVTINPKFYRPLDHVQNLVGDSTKAWTTLDWKPMTDFSALITLMVQADLAELQSHV
jgi:GDPmannose 4,6-dehydratase